MKNYSIQTAGEVAPDHINREWLALAYTAVFLSFIAGGVTGAAFVMMVLK
jgi:hypothetical protein